MVKKTINLKEPVDEKISKKDSKKKDSKKKDSKKIYCGIDNPIPVGYRLGSMQECFDVGKVMYYGVKKIDSKVLDSKKNNDLDENALQIKKVGLMGKITKIKKDLLKIDNINEQNKLKKEYDLIAKEINSIEEKIKKKSIK